MHTVAFTARQQVHGFLLIPALKVKGRAIGAAVHLGITQLNDLCTP